MAAPLVSDELWAAIEPLLPPEPPKPKGGRPRIADRKVLAGILFVLRTGIPWEYLPQETGCGSGMTCWRRLRDWQRAGVWQKLHQGVRHGRGDSAHYGWPRAALGSGSRPAKRGARRPGRIQRIKENRARSAMLWSTPRASRSRSS